MQKGKTVLLVVVALAVVGLLVFMGGGDQAADVPSADNGDAPAATTTNGGGADADADAPADDGGDNQTVQEVQDVSEDEVVNQLPPAVFNASGEVTEVGGSYLMVQTDGSHMETGEEVEVRVNVSESTNILDANNNPIPLADVGAGSQVSIEASGNIKNATQFSASNVKITE